MVRWAFGLCRDSFAIAVASVVFEKSAAGLLCDRVAGDINSGFCLAVIAGL